MRKAPGGGSFTTISEAMKSLASGQPRRSAAKAGGIAQWYH
ncbi:hypothetical protein [Psychrobacter pacificensis]